MPNIFVIIGVIVVIIAILSSWGCADAAQPASRPAPATGH